jgi:hypothetical protein
MHRMGISSTRWMRQNNGACGALPDCTVNIDPSLVRVDNRIDNRQTKTGPLILRREKRIEYARLMGRSDANAGVLDGQSNSGYAKCLRRFLAKTDR